MVEHHAPDSDSLERCQKRGSPNIDFTALALQEDSRMSHESLDIEDSIGITSLVDFTKTQRSFLSHMHCPIAGCDYLRYFEAYTSIATRAQ